LVFYLLWAYPFHCAAEVCLLAVHLPENMRLSEFFSLLKLLILVSCRCFNNNAVLPSIRIALHEIVVQVACWDVRCKLVKSNDLVLFGERRLLLNLAWSSNRDLARRVRGLLSERRLWFGVGAFGARGCKDWISLRLWLLLNRYGWLELHNLSTSSSNRTIRLRHGYLSSHINNIISAILMLQEIFSQLQTLI
jgi:hypothetical protein